MPMTCGPVTTRKEIATRNRWIVIYCSGTASCGEYACIPSVPPETVVTYGSDFCNRWTHHDLGTVLSSQDRARSRPQRHLNAETS